jgi:hypothetical protein
MPIVLEGETGTGKEIVARAIHGWSGRRGRFVAVNCAALPQTLAEAELFGYRRGAFTGADRASPGLFRSADQGTLLLDEVVDLPLPRWTGIQGECNAVARTWPRGRRERPLVDGDGIGLLGRHDGPEFTEGGTTG